VGPGLRPVALLLAAALLACAADTPPDACPGGYPAGTARPAGCSDPGVDWLAFTFAGRGASIPAVFIGKPDGSCIQRLTSDAAYSGDPAFFPGGKRLVYASTRSGLNQLYVRDLVTGSETRLDTSYTFAPPTGTATLSAASPSVSPDGTTVAFEGGLVAYPGWTDLFTVPAAGGTVVRVTHDPAAATNPRWSLDGARLYFISYQSGPAEIRSISLDGSAEAAVTTGSSLASRFDLSGDGRSLAYARHSTTGTGSQPTELVAFDLATSSVRVISSTNEADPAVDASSTSVAISRRNAASGYDLFLLDYATGDVKRQLTSCPGQAFAAAFAR
jgi:Tol biopolymer transport system component